ncbi:extracellular solute-binding protein [Paenibacillus sp. FSL H7-0326]|uniref:extracellular solute-binding protein n=1 Tax=Paenibacillus sp. FSL H7-0326 TaxID=1921144 RepID=UPI002116921E|nr:extracellular solute-binding protein [Paenibacillus sp. FSL H7-0326]
MMVLFKRVAWGRRIIAAGAGLLSMMIVTACNSGALKAELQVPAEEKLPISMMVPLHFPHPPSDEIMDRIEQLTHTELEINWITDGIYTDKLNTALTTNSMKKVTFVKHIDYPFIKNAIRTDAFWEIGSYIEEFPNLRYLDSGILEQTAVDGRIYGLYTERPSSRQGVIIREDWLDRLGLETPKTLDQLYEVMRAFTFSDPDGNGLHDTIGLADRNDLTYGAFKTLSSYFGTPNNWLVKGNTLIPEFETQAYMDTMNFMKKLVKEKLINQDFAVTSKDVQRDMIITGKAGVYIGSMTDVQRLYDETKVLNPDARFTLSNRIQGPAGYKVWSIPNYNGVFLFSKKAIETEAELKKILGFFDRTMDEDVANLMRYGIEGIHYTVQDGKVLLDEGTSILRVNEVNPLYTLMIADLSNPNVMPIAKQEALTALAEELSMDNEKFLVQDPTLHLESDTYAEKNVELETLISDATYHYILGNLDQEGFAREIERWKQLGGEDIIQEYTAAYFK